NEFSQTTEPSIDKGLLADVRGTLNQSPAAHSYAESAPTGPLTTVPSASYFESAPTGPLVAPSSAPAPASPPAPAPAHAPEPAPAPAVSLEPSAPSSSQNKLLIAVIALLAIIAVLLGILLFTQK